jgi:disulfide bond formation protein DsbB
MTRFREIAWPWAALLVAVALVAQEFVLRWLSSQPAIAGNAWRIGVIALGLCALVLLALPRRRAAFALAALVCAALIGYALYAQHVLGLEPCPLCIFQRIAVIVCGVIFALAAIHNPGRTGAIVYAVLGAFAAAAGAAISMRHVWTQSQPPAELTACAPGLDYMLETLPFSEVLSKVFLGRGDCATIDWNVLGVSMPGWTLVFFLAMLVGSLAVIDRD